MAGATPPSDRRLLRAARRGSPGAVEALVERHWARAHRIAYGVLGDAHAAEDVTQEAMLSIVGGIGGVDLRRPFEPWLHRIVVNRALDWSRSRARRPEVRLPAGVQIGSGEPEPAPPQSLDAELEAALAELSPEHRAVVVLRYIGGYGPEEIGKLLEMPRGTVGSRLRRALDQLRAGLEEEDG
jgi:RNA polymerase sigma-70 factor, ECF subfamily